MLFSKHFGFLLGLCLIHVHYAQQRKIDSLFTELKKWQNKIGYQADTMLYNIYYNIGLQYQTSNLDTSIYFIEQSIIKARILKDAIKESKSVVLIGWSYYSKGDYTTALEKYEKALSLLPERPAENDKKTKQKVYASIMANTGAVYNKIGDYSKSLEYYFKSLKINELISSKREQASNLMNIGGVYGELKNYGKASECFLKALKIYENIGDKRGLAITYGNFGILYTDLKKNKEAEQYLKKAIAMFEKLHNIYYLRNFNHHLYKLYLQTGQYKEALEVYKKHIIYKDSVFRQENRKAAIQKEMQYKFEKQQTEERTKHQIELAQKEEESRRQKIIIFSAILLLLTLGFFMWRINKQRRIIQGQKLLVERQKILVEEKNKEITDSILYARKIQDAILPDEIFWNHLLPDSFILYLPKDIVAGDFYWLAETDDYIFVAAADCTGHGVPGAMVSVTCYNALNKALMEDKLLNTNEILDKTRELVVNQLHSHQQGQLQDGMDICLVRINKHNLRQIQYSGANRSLVFIHQGQISEIKPDKQPIGFYENARVFSVHNIELPQDTCLYLFTDGYADQFGGDKGKKLGNKKWKEMLQAISPMNIKEQEVYLSRFFMEWKNKEYQTDDVTVLGIRV